jgi:hypothetical protein
MMIRQIAGKSEGKAVADKPTDNRGVYQRAQIRQAFTENF